MKLIVGLGNPDRKYTETRHNVGFIVVDSYLGSVDWKEKFNAKYYIKDDVCFIKPLTYMNNSGNAVKAFMDYYKINVEDILIIQDDLDMEIGTYKLKMNSSDGGHNGIKSIISCLHSDAFLRLKIGISNKYKEDAIDFVLGKFSRNELSSIKDNAEFNKIIDLFINEGSLKAINSYRS